MKMMLMVGMISLFAGGCVQGKQPRIVNKDLHAFFQNDEFVIVRKGLINKDDEKFIAIGPGTVEGVVLEKLQCRVNYVCLIKETGRVWTIERHRK